MKQVSAWNKWTDSITIYPLSEIKLIVIIIYVKIMSEITESKSFEIKERKFGLTLTSFENAIALYIYEDVPRIGTFGISVPGTSIMPASTLYITGAKNEHYAKMMGERLATKLQKLVLISLSVKDANTELIVELIQKIEATFFDDISNN